MAKKNVVIPQDPMNVRQAQTWYRSTGTSLRTKLPGKIMANVADLTSKMGPYSIGRMYMFYYDPKTKDDLPYWDQFPLIFPIQMYKDGFLGINLHYIQPLLRAKVMDSLYDLISNTKMDNTTRLKLSYRILSGLSRYPLVKPCIKRYLFNHVRSRYFYIEPNNWDLALMLPTEQFQKASKQKVFKDSRGSI